MHIFDGLGRITLEYGGETDSGDHLCQEICTAFLSVSRR